MSAFYTVLAGLVLVALLVRAYCPYLLLDLRFLLKGIRMALRIRGFTRSGPAGRCYTVLDRFVDAVRTQPEKTFLIFEDQRFSYREADRRSNRVARALLQHAPLREGDTVALFLGNEPDFVWTWMGLAKLGCTVSLLNHNIRSKSLLHCFTCCRASVLITGPGERDLTERRQTDREVKRDRQTRRETDIVQRHRQREAHRVRARQADRKVKRETDTDGQQKRERYREG